jgi:hypothetical protein
MAEEHQGTKKQPENQMALERHYTITEISELWHLDEKIVRRMFEHEADILAFGSTETRYKRRYRSVRIPESVMRRVHRKMTRAS